MFWNAPPADTPVGFGGVFNTPPSPGTIRTPLLPVPVIPPPELILISNLPIPELIKSLNVTAASNGLPSSPLRTPTDSLTDCANLFASGSNPFGTICVPLGLPIRLFLPGFHIHKLH